ncbi:heterokaryon incompatibility protein-domain-containing protein [Cadophora sp. MPI-SDFR-AT-0126]|nr:heterokaryon incompatibility protein-domain-containing protein [Leotiomycetes sp. MPI-SDFR-AT-0126]
MRLIDVETYEIREFFGRNIPSYAILSHTWVEEEEVTFLEMDKLHGLGRTAFDGQDGPNFRISSKPGYKKIMHACRQARKDKLLWVWVDTCCIDKSSSAELTEAINSMFQWYRASSVCYAYLSDVPQRITPQFSTEHVASGSDLDTESSIRSSRWFTRGWTLQELIAPQKMELFGQNWCALGSRFERREIISNITRIPESLIDSYTEGPNLDGFSVAQKMSWAAKRQCTRIEDSAYCLLGIFGINMPLLYGEGENAFLRFQEEIFRVTDDHSLLAWTSQYKCDSNGSVFATSPLDFLYSGNIERLHNEIGAPSLVTKKGLQISLPLEEESTLASLHYPYYHFGQKFHAILNCGERATEKTNRILLVLVKDDGMDQDSSQPHCYQRIYSNRHIGVQDRIRFRNPSMYETVFLRTPRQKLCSYYFKSKIIPPFPIQFHVHGISFDFVNERQHLTNQGLGYTVKEASYLTNGTAADTPFDPQDITTRGDFYIFRMKLHSNVGLPPLESRCEFTRYGVEAGRVQLSVESQSEPTLPGIASRFVDLKGLGGVVLRISIPVEQSMFTLTLHCQSSGGTQPRNNRVMGSDGRAHFHIHISSQPISQIQPCQNPTDLGTQILYNFFSILRGTKFYQENMLYAAREGELRILC